jgi:hypothetical protein
MKIKSSVTTKSGCIDLIVRGLLRWRIRRAKEKAEYWRGKAEMWRALCQGNHSSYEREYLAEATGKWLLYDQRVTSLSAREVISRERDLKSFDCPL